MRSRQVADNLPRHDDFSTLRTTYEWGGILLAAALLAWQAGRLATTPGLIAWWTPVALVLGALAADFVSGLVHWTADTWGSETMPILGRRFVRPFRVHHVNPGDFLRRNFADTNGDVAAIVSGFLLVMFCIPLDRGWGKAMGAFFLAFCAVGLPTNQVHQWAHMSRPPRLVRWLQACSLILSRRAHQRHHRAPYAMNYCIATGWCNAFLTRIDFFRRLERAVARITGLVPRADDTAFQAEVERTLTGAGNERR